MRLVVAKSDFVICQKLAKHSSCFSMYSTKNKITTASNHVPPHAPCAVVVHCPLLKNTIDYFSKTIWMFANQIDQSLTANPRASFPKTNYHSPDRRRVRNADPATYLMHARQTNFAPN